MAWPPFAGIGLAYQASSEEGPALPAFATDQRKGIMRGARQLTLWLILGLLGALLLTWGLPRAFPLLPLGWEVNAAEAEAIALERLRDLGPEVRDPYVAVNLRSDQRLERRLLLEAPEVGLEALRQSQLSRSLAAWDVWVYPPAALVRGWRYRASISTRGEVLVLRHQPAPAQPARPILPGLPGETGGESTAGEGDISESDVAGGAAGSQPSTLLSLPVPPSSTDPVDETLPEPLDRRELQGRALDYLASQRFDLGLLEQEAELLQRRDGGRLEQTLQFPWREQVLGGDYRYGLEVYFVDDQVSGFGRWHDDPDTATEQQVFQQAQVLGLSQWGIIYLLLTLVAVPFLRRYHDGQLGVRRGVQIFLFILGAGLVWIVLEATSWSSGVNIGFASRQQTTWVVGLMMFLTRIFALAVLALMCWAVGEFLCRERWPHKLASMDALFRLRWTNATVARASLRGLAGGLLMAGIVVAGSALLGHLGAWPMSTALFGFATGVRMPGLSLLVGLPTVYLPLGLCAILLVPGWAMRRLGTAGGLAVSLLAAALLVPAFFSSLPLQLGIVPWLLGLLVPLLLFRYGDLLSALLALTSSGLFVGAYPLLAAGDSGLQLQGAGAVVLASLPLLVSLRYLGSSREFDYRYDDVPPHVRRIAERERQRVELETARNIQSSILPELPEQLHGVEIAHAYLPATEVGGDFYDVLALDDGRLAVAVGDVAGHGVSSGLVMSMAKSALAVQVAFDPQVDSVFRTLNRMVYQSARQRLLTTLCYAILDPEARELYYASAGHLFPYRVSQEGKVHALEAIAYPLGVRGALEVRVRLARLEPGDTVFLYSDGLVEAMPEGDEEPYGFERLEASLRRHAGKSPRQLRDEVLMDVDAYTGIHPREDDLTVLVLRLPSAA